MAVLTVRKLRSRPYEDVKKTAPDGAVCESLLARRPEAAARVRSADCLRLVLDDFGDGAHGAFLNAVATSDAAVLVHDLGGAVDDLENLLRASVNANAATDAIVSFNDWMGHGFPLSQKTPRGATSDG